MTKSHLLCTIAAAATMLASATAETKLGVWNPARSSGSDADLVLENEVSEEAILGREGSTAKIEKNSAFPDKAAVVFDGSQSASIRTKNSVPGIGTGMRVELTLLVDGSSAEGTVFNTAPLELRYDPANETLSAIAYLESDPGYVVAKLPVKTDVWTKVTVRLDESEVSLDVDGNTNAKPLSGSLLPGKAAVHLGMKNDARPLKGKIGIVKIIQE